MFTIIGAIGLLLAGLMLKRQREAIAKGKFKGRKPAARGAAVEIATLKADGVRPIDMASSHGIGASNRIADFRRGTFDRRDRHR
jgi:hypothetical protein